MAEELRLEAGQSSTRTAENHDVNGAGAPPWLIRRHPTSILPCLLCAGVVASEDFLPAAAFWRGVLQDAGEGLLRALLKRMINESLLAEDTLKPRDRNGGFGPSSICRPNRSRPVPWLRGVAISLGSHPARHESRAPGASLSAQHLGHDRQPRREGRIHHACDPLCAVLPPPPPCAVACTINYTRVRCASSFGGGRGELLGRGGSLPNGSRRSIAIAAVHCPREALVTTRVPSSLHRDSGSGYERRNRSSLVPKKRSTLLTHDGLAAVLGAGQENPMGMRRDHRAGAAVGAPGKGG